MPQLLHKSSQGQEAPRHVQRNMSSLQCGPSLNKQPTNIVSQALLLQSGGGPLLLQQDRQHAALSSGCVQLRQALRPPARLRPPLRAAVP